MSLPRVGLISLLATAGTLAGGCGDDGGGGDTAASTTGTAGDDGGPGTSPTGSASTTAMGTGTGDGTSTGSGPGDTTEGPTTGGPTSTGSETGAESDSGSGDTGAESDSGSSGTTGMALDCEGFVGQASPAEVALTPYASLESEVLAYELSGEVVAPEAVYERINTDLLAIRAAYAQVANIFAMPSWDPNSLIVSFDPTGVTEIMAGTYDAWDCPNDLYNATLIDLDLLDFIGAVVINYDGRYNAPLLANDYIGLPNVTYAEPNGAIGDGNDVCASADGELYTYIFDAGSGDCPAGCIDHTYWGFTVDGQGAITYLGTFSNAGPAAAWFTTAPACTMWL